MQKVTKLFVETKKVVSIELDARHQIGGRRAVEQRLPAAQRAQPASTLFRAGRAARRARNQMADALVELKAKAGAGNPGRADHAHADAGNNGQRSERPRASITRRHGDCWPAACWRWPDLAPPALAHRSQTVLIDRDVERGGRRSLEVTHRLHAHDAELCLAADDAGAPQVGHHGREEAGAADALHRGARSR